MMENMNQILFLVGSVQRGVRKPACPPADFLLGGQSLFLYSRMRTHYLLQKDIIMAMSGFEQQGHFHFVMSLTSWETSVEWDF